MRHVVLFLFAVYLTLFLVVLNRGQKKDSTSTEPVLRVFGYSTFTGSTGPGPGLKDLFEKSCQCHVEFIDASDSGILLQRLKLEGESLGADLVIGFDQYDLQKALGSHKWRKLEFGNLNVEPEVREVLTNSYFVPYDWGVLSFVARPSELSFTPNKLKDLLHPSLARKISLQHPRSSSPGLQFLFWVVRTLGEDEGFHLIENLFDQVHSYSESWATSYGFFQKKQSSLVFSYLTSPIYHQLVEKDESVQALPWNEPLPVQFEFMGIPEFCRQCRLAENFVNLMLSPEGQKLVMEKNYMFPVLQGVRQGTAFDPLRMGATGASMKLMPFEIPTQNEVDRLLKRWSELRSRGKN